MSIESLRTTIETSEDIEELRSAALEACEQAESAAVDVASLEKEIAKLEEEVESFEGFNTSILSHLQLKFPRLFTGDLSKLDHAERSDLFESIANLSDGSHSHDSERTLARIDGKL